MRVSEADDQSTGIWRPLTVRGVPLHFVLPAITAVVGLSLLAGGGLSAVLGAWILTIGFSLAVGAFVADDRALAAPAVIWTAWVLVSSAAGPQSGLPRTPIGLALVLAGLGAVCVWLGQRAVQPAVEGARVAGRSRGIDTDIDALLEPVQPPEESLSLDPSAEVDEALAALLVESDDRVEAGDDGTPERAPQPQGEGEASAASPAPTVGDDGPPAPAPSAPDEDDDETGHVIEFAALSEDDLVEDEAPLPAATEAGRRHDTAD